jgi:hypothetical protein
MLDEIRTETETLFQRLERTFGVRLGGTFVALTRAADGSFVPGGTFTIRRDGGDPPAPVSPAPSPSTSPPAFERREDPIGDPPHPDAFPGTDEGSHYVSQAKIERAPMGKGVAAARAVVGKAASELAASAGYTGDACTNCGGFRMKRAGTCAVCEDCGTTGGCS